MCLSVQVIQVRKLATLKTVFPTAQPSLSTWQVQIYWLITAAVFCLKPVGINWFILTSLIDKLACEKQTTATWLSLSGD